MNINVNDRQIFIIFLGLASFHPNTRKSFGNLIPVSVAQAMPGRVAMQKKKNVLPCAEKCVPLLARVLCGFPLHGKKRSAVRRKIRPIVNKGTMWFSFAWQSCLYIYYMYCFCFIVPDFSKIVLTVALLPSDKQF